MLLEVRAGELRTQPELSGVAATSDLGRQSPEGFQCALEDFAGREWAVCRQDGSPTSVAQYLIEGDTVYQVGFDTDVSATDLAVVRATILSLQAGAGDQSSGR